MILKRELSQDFIKVLCRKKIITLNIIKKNGRRTVVFLYQRKIGFTYVNSNRNALIHMYGESLHGNVLYNFSSLQNRRHVSLEGKLAVRDTVVQ